MKVTITFDCELENDGYDGYSQASRSGVEDLVTLSQFITDAVKGAGFDYVVDVGFEKSDGNITFGGF